MADEASRSGPPSLRRRFALWFGLLFIGGAVAIRVLHYQASAALLARDLDVQLWARLAAVKAQERFAPDTLLDPHFRSDGMFLPDLPAAGDQGMPGLLGVVAAALGPPADDGAFRWFAGVWRTDGTRVDSLDLPAGLDWDPSWRARLDTLWTSDAGAYRLAATAGAHDSLIVVGAPLERLAAAERRALLMHAATFALWVPLVLGIAWLLLTRLLAPLAGVVETARRIRAGHFEERIDATRADVEFGDLAGTINDMLDRLDAIRLAQSRFNADVAHQLLNPVHAILLEADPAGAADDPGSASAVRQRIAALARRIEALCETLLAYSRSAALDPNRLRPVDLEPILAVAVERVTARATARGITIVSPSAGGIVKGDAALLEEVFVNLLANAVEHAPAGGRVEIVVGDGVVGDGAEGCRVAVVDHGSGVAPADLPHLFERFRSGKPAGGHGIGLALSHRILESHGGDIVHEPTPGGGATFVVRFPAGHEVPVNGA
jgi:signal transduction histidine kinase